MPRSKYSRFKDGVHIGGIAIQVPHTGKTFYVCNSSTVQPLGIAGSDGNNGLTPEQPFSTIDKAINSSTAGRGDTIIVMPGHAETIADATSLVPDVSGVKIIGTGEGELRPVITFATSTSANIPVSGANTVISGLVFKCNIASQTAMVTVTGTDVTIENCDFREGSAVGLVHLIAGAADNDADRLTVRNCRFYQPTAGVGDAAIQINKDLLNVLIEDVEIDGDFDNGSIEVPTAGNAQVNLRIQNSTIKNRLTNVAAISIAGTDNSGIIRNCLLRTDTLATALDNGSLATDNVTWADETDQVSSSKVLPDVDSATNFIGVDDADNAVATTNVASNRDGSILERLEAIYAAQVDDVAANMIGIDDSNNVAATTNVVANVDGSILERLEALMDPLGGYDPLLGFRVTKTSNMADGSGTDNLFTVTGRCLITHLSGEVTTVIGTTTTMKLRDVTNSVDLCAATTITTDAVGTMYSLTSITANILNGTGATPVIGSVPNITGALPMPMAIVGNVQGALTLAHVLDGAGTGAVAWVLYYKPLTASSTITAAA